MAIAYLDDYPDKVLTIQLPTVVNNTEYIYYLNDGTCLGGKESSERVYFTDKNSFDTAKKNKKWSRINIESKAVKLFSNHLSHKDLLDYGGIVHGEATQAAAERVGVSKHELKKERYAFANTIYNFMKSRSKIKKVSDIPLHFAYARKDKTAPYKKIANSTGETRTNEWIKTAIYAVFNAVTGGKDYSNGATQWDGGDVFTGNYHSGYKPMLHFRQQPSHYERRLKGIYDKNNLSKDAYDNLKKYYSQIDTHRAKHLKPLTVYKSRTNWDILYYEEKSYMQYTKGKLSYDKVKLVDSNGKPPKYNTNTVPLVSSGSTRTWLFAGLNCLWEVTAQHACTLFYKEIKKYDKSIINANEAPFI